MVYTFAFSQSEYWCWKCGSTTGMFDGFPRRFLSESEQEELDKKKILAEDYLDARGCMYGGGHKKINGKLVPFDEFPAEMQEKAKRYVNSWEYEIV